MPLYPTYQYLDLAQIAQKIGHTWRKEDTFQQSIQRRQHNPTFTFYEGPPSVNGEPGIHHVLARTVKDIFARYKTLQGYQVQRKGGWDTHGLPVELQVEKELGITKEDIGTKISMKAYNAHCRETVMRYKTQWEALTEQLGYWLDTQNPYMTLSPDYIETAWYWLKQLHQKGLLYKGHTIQPYSPAAGTGLSSHELSQPGCYKMVKDIAITAQFQTVGDAQTYLLAWTTTPWTLPANSALAVGKDIVYVKVDTYNPYTHQRVHVILAQAALDRFFPHPSDSAALANYRPGTQPIPWKILTHYTGSDLVGHTYAQLMPYIQPNQPAFRVILGDFVTTTEGTGIVHIAPTFGADDKRVAEANGIPPITVQRNGQAVPIVDKQGRFVTEMGPWACQYVKAAYEPETVRRDPAYASVDTQIAAYLKKHNKAFQVQAHTHSYPHCWRTDKPILYYPLDAWFIKTTAYKERLIALNQTINWQPTTTGRGRFGDWLANLVDWNLSRDRFWGTPLPIWRTRDQQSEKCIGSVQELQAAVAQAVAAGHMDQPLPDDFDLHRPDVDQIVLVSDQGEPMYREPDLVDVWFDAGIMPYAQWHYPFENVTAFQQHFPADFIAEGVDQTRGWFFTLHALATLLFDQVAFKNVVSNGLVLDKYGQKMSKRLGNVVNPFQIMAAQGPDALRWYLMTNTPPWDNLKFDPEGPAEVIRKFFMTLHNTYNFFALYAHLDGFDARTAAAIPVARYATLDRWLISQLHTLNQTVTAAYEAYDPTQAGRAIQDFVLDDLSNWYVRLNRKRFWQAGHGVDKQVAYQTLHTCLITLAQLAAPIAPFYMDQLYRDLCGNPSGNATSVHLTDWPAVDTASIDPELTLQMQQARVVVSLVHALRKQHNLKVRQPLAQLMIATADLSKRRQIAAVEDCILAEVNVKQATYAEDAATVVVKKVRPNFKRLGQRYKGQMQSIAQALAQLTQSAIQALEQIGYIDLDMSPSIPASTLVVDRHSAPIRLTREDVVITSTDIPGWSVAQEGDITVALDRQLTDTLRQEGIARELVSHVQNMRKKQTFAVQDKIVLQVASEAPLVTEAIAAHKPYICQETQAIQLIAGAPLPQAKAVQVHGHTLYIQVSQAQADTLA
ncbi:MAG: isoleucine--tRNA ligase [Bacteroidota bacterium]